MNIVTTTEEGEGELSCSEWIYSTELKQYKQIYMAGQILQIILLLLLLLHACSLLGFFFCCCGTTNIHTIVLKNKQLFDNDEHNESSNKYRSTVVAARAVE